MLLFSTLFLLNNKFFIPTRDHSCAFKNQPYSPCTQPRKLWELCSEIRQRPANAPLRAGLESALEQRRDTKRFFAYFLNLFHNAKLTGVVGRKCHERLMKRGTWSMNTIWCQVFTSPGLSVSCFLTARDRETRWQLPIKVWHHYSVKEEKQHHFL